MSDLAISAIENAIYSSILQVFHRRYVTVYTVSIPPGTGKGKEVRVRDGRNRKRVRFEFMGRRRNGKRNKNNKQVRERNGRRIF